MQKLFEREFQNLNHLVLQDFTTARQTWTFLIQRYSFLLIKDLYMQKPESLTTFGRSEGTYSIKLNIKFLTPDCGGQFTPARYGQGHWLFQFIMFQCL